MYKPNNHRPSLTGERVAKSDPVGFFFVNISI